jgi:CSLREA domain-containing protein
MLKIEIKRRTILLTSISALALFLLAGTTTLRVRAADPDVTAIITVDSTGDGSDANISDNICDDGAGSCTLRAAIEEANNTAGTQTIEFAIVGAGVHTITPLTLYPTIAAPININGYSQNQTGSVAAANTAVAPAPMNGTIQIEINGSAVDNFLIFSGGAGGSAGSSVRGLAINRFTGTALHIGAHDVTIAGNYIGTAADGLTDQGNGFAGITNDDPSTASDGAQIGGLNAADRNIISGNESAAVYPRNNWVIQGNYIGVDKTGLTKLANSVFDTGSGGLSIDDCEGVIVGGPETGATNVISGNNNQGIAPDLTEDLTIQGNYIGVGADGTTPIPNDAMGIDLKQSNNALIGGSAAGEGNIISNSGSQGIYLDNNNTNITIQGNTLNDTDDIGMLISDSSDVVIGGLAAGEGNIISSSDFQGIYLANSSADITILGNDITDSGSQGIIIDSATGITVGGTSSGAANVISGSTLSGINASSNVSDLVIQGNTIEDNVQYGISIQSSASVTIGGSATGAGNDIKTNTLGGIFASSSSDLTIQSNSVTSNIEKGIFVQDSPSSQLLSNVVSDNDEDGISLSESGLTTVTGNTLETNLEDGIEIVNSDGVNLNNNQSTSNEEYGIRVQTSDDVSLDGDEVSSNTFDGIEVTGSENFTAQSTDLMDNERDGVTINSTGAGIYDSVISGNGGNGVSIDTGADDAVIQGNIITANAQTTATAGGIYLGASGAILGGQTSSARNVISDNRGQANIMIVGFGVNVTDNIVQGNYIGTDVDGTENSLFTQTSGIVMAGLVSDNLIGGTLPGQANLISGNDGTGIQIAQLQIPTVFDMAPVNNAVIGNSIVSNNNGTFLGNPVPGLGIDNLIINPGDGSTIEAGVTLNDVDDTDTGANNFMNFPVVNSASQNLLELAVNLDLDVADSPTNQYRVEFFANDAADPSGYGEGQTFLGSTIVSPGDDQNVSVAMPTGTNLTGKVLSATTTAVDGATTSGFGSTSEFSLVSDIDIIALPSADDEDSSGLLANTGQSILALALVAATLVSASLLITTRHSRRTVRT